ncbi:hypothetical protein BJP36_36615 [Moorena producens JHB]|uniref:Uncharacterized protein n=1 Tax=Moorena producens (strain JHB) TaxID=1454205 RepID=A0A9Q9UW80_MOOP1|nr:hypothetical protein [Moorena producens]WAN69620.1 hypothetical protein BJP36_36615 [Moorena producens JHB]
MGRWGDGEMGRWGVHVGWAVHQRDFKAGHNVTRHCPPYGCQSRC